MTARVLPVTAVSLAFVLAACTGREGDTDEAAGAAQVETVQSAQPAASAAAGSPSLALQAPEDGAAQAGAAIPQGLQGRWGMVAGDCTSTRGDAKGLLKVAGDQLEFYESVARLRDVRESTAGHLRAEFFFTGEGEEWTQDMTFDLADGGRTLVRRDHEVDGPTEPMTYTRC